MTDHVALLLPDLRTGGAQRVILTLARSFLAKGLKVDIIIGLAEGDLLAEVPTNARLISICTKSPSLGRFGLAFIIFLQLRKYLKQQRPHALLSTLSGTNIVAAVAYHFSNTSTRLVLREASRLINLRSNFYKRIMRFTYPWANAIVALTPEMQHDIVTEISVPAAKIVQIRNPIDINKLRFDASIDLPADFDVSIPYVLSVGRLEPPKDYITLIRAFSEVHKLNQVKLVILGEGPDRNKIETLIRDFSLEKQIELRGLDTNPYRWMKHAALFVLSSRWEGYPNVVIEAQSLGVPVIATEYDTSVHSIIKKPGQIVPINNEQALANAITSLLESSVTKNALEKSRTANHLEDTVSEQSEVSLSNESVEKYLKVLGMSEDR
jgi:glycosyltransferase involved in cell wall biosynthesis